MKKIPSLFKRNRETGLIYDEVTPGCEWALTSGLATVKWDGTSVMIDGNKMYKRYDAKRGRTPPADFIPAQDPDPVTGHWPGWVPVTLQDKWHMEAMPGPALLAVLPPGTFELIGPKVQGNPHHQVEHTLVRHGTLELDIPVPRTFESIRDIVERDTGIEGVVFYRDVRPRWIGDIRGDMCKVKRKDFGLPWPIEKFTEEVTDAAI